MNDPVLTRRDELLADGALGWLEGGDDAALEAVLREPAARSEFEALDRAAAVAARALAEPQDELQPALVALTARLHTDAVQFFAPAAGNGPSAAGSARGVPFARVAPWMLAAAAVLFAAWPLRHEPVLSPPRARDALLQANDRVVTCTLQPGPTGERGHVRGDVVWDAARQEGYLRLEGLPVLDEAHRYQLWIVDAAREGPPVDGGLLPPLADEGEAVVRIDARLPVQRAAAFVLTREQAAGVVVSAQEHVVAIAKP